MSYLFLFENTSNFVNDLKLFFGQIKSFDKKLRILMILKTNLWKTCGKNADNQNLIFFPQCSLPFRKQVSQTDVVCNWF